MTRVNPFTLEVVRNAIYSIAEEMRSILMQSARSALLKEAGDMSCALTDADGRLIAQGRDIPIHLGIMAFTVKEFLKAVPRTALAPGDVYFTNAVDVGGNHLPDVKAIKPIFVDGTVVAFAVNLAHWPDIGGPVPGSYHVGATELIQEGLQIPPVRLFSREGVNRDLLAMIACNTCGGRDREGDIRAQVAANEVAGKRLEAVFEQYGRAVVLACFERFLDESEGLMRAALRQLPPGEYVGDDYLDDDGIDTTPIRVAVRITATGDRLCFDFSESDPQVSGPVNCTYFSACSAVYYAARALFGPEIPANDGCYRPLEVTMPEGSVLNPGRTAPRVGSHESAHRVVDAIFKALAPALPDRAVAGGAASSGVLIISGTRSGAPFIFVETHGGGEGASRGRPGEAGIRVHLSNTMNTPVEAVEAEFPILVESYGLREGSGGAGAHRGGEGVRRAYRILCPRAEVSTMFERCTVAPWGLFGGMHAEPSRIVVTHDRVPERAVRGKARVSVREGDVVVVETAGGGGCGVPDADAGEDIPGH